MVPGTWRVGKTPESFTRPAHFAGRRGAGRSLAAGPGRVEGEDARIDGAGGLVRAGQVARAHQELAHDLAAREDERFLEELLPGRELERVVRIQPAGEGAEALSQGEDAACVLDRRVDFEAVADDA